VSSNNGGLGHAHSPNLANFSTLVSLSFTTLPAIQPKGKVIPVKEIAEHSLCRCEDYE